MPLFSVFGLESPLDPPVETLMYLFLENLFAMFKQSSMLRLGMALSH